MKCSFGCNKEAKFFFKSGNCCCEKSPNKCEAKKKRDSDKKKGDFKGVPYWKIENAKYIPWNKGKRNIYSEEYKKKISISLKKWWKEIDKNSEKILKRNKNLSESLKKSENSGGVRKGGGRGKKGWYKGFWCDSSWELAWVIYHLEHGFSFERNWEGFQYFFENKNRRYYPDFIIENIYYEIKGRKSYEKLDEKNKEKIKQFKGKLVVLFEDDMKKYIDYAKLKYGEDYSSLYDEKNFVKRVCVSCQKNISNKNKNNFCIICFNKNRIKNKNIKKHNKKEKKYFFCKNCNKKITKNAKYNLCNTCSRLNKRKVERPSLEQLLKEVEEIGYCAVGRKYGVSDNAIRKWIKNYQM